MTRFPDWRQRLYDLIESRHQAAFSWANNNGGIWAADAVHAITGEWLYPDELREVAASADVYAEAEARAALPPLESALAEAKQEMALRQATAKSRAALFDHTLRDEAELAVKEQQLAINAARDAVHQHTQAIQAAAKRVMDPIMAAVESCGGLVAMVTARLGAPLPGVLCAKDGDLVIADTTAGPCLGIVDGAHAIFVSDVGLSRIRLGRATKAWAIAREEAQIGATCRDALTSGGKQDAAAEEPDGIGSDLHPSDGSPI